MKTNEGNYVMCIFTGKICYTEREAGLVINGCGFYHVTHLALYDMDSQNYAWEDAFY